MGLNSSKFDQDAYYGKMTMRELLALQEEHRKFIEDHPEFAHQESTVNYTEKLRLVIAERIGR